MPSGEMVVPVFRALSLRLRFSVHLALPAFYLAQQKRPEILESSGNAKVIGSSAQAHGVCNARKYYLVMRMSLAAPRFRAIIRLKSNLFEVQCRAHCLPCTSAEELEPESECRKRYRLKFE